VTVTIAPVVTARWPALAGLGLAGLIAADLADGVELAPVLALSATVYLGAAVLGRRAAWWVLLAGSAGYVAVQATDPGLDPTWVVLTAAAALGLTGLAGRPRRPPPGPTPGSQPEPDRPLPEPRPGHRRPLLGARPRRSRRSPTSRPGTRSRQPLAVQAAALAAFGGVAGLALAVAPTAGGWLVAAGLTAHAGWDVVHHRADRVVPRSMSEFCLVLDLALAAAIAAVTVT
jgi:hypothetical protein